MRRPFRQDRTPLRVHCGQRNPADGFHFSRCASHCSYPTWDLIRWEMQEKANPGRLRSVIAAARLPAPSGG